MTEITDIADKLRAQPRNIRADDIVREIRRLLGEQDIATIYEQRIRTMRTRRYELKAPTRKVPVEVQHTLLGIELKIGQRRLLCPDLATARYLAVFARLGLEAVAVPYDITQISRLADALESAWFRMLMLADHLTKERSARLHSLVLSHLIAQQRAEIVRIGTGAAVPQFNQNTRQRRR